jgi:CHAT domain-containing protein/tetratricopeptide (TPR) repeat protein
MDNDLFLQHLRDLPLEEGMAYLQAHVDELTDHAAIAALIADEALHQLYIAPLVSLKLAELLIFFGEYHHSTLAHALGLKAKGDALRFVGHYQAAMECLDAAGEEFLHLGDEVNWAHTRISWIVACGWLGRVEEALQQATRAREVFLRHGEHYWACAVDHNTAVIYTWLGRYQDAIHLYERMQAVYPTITDKSETFIKRAIAIAENNQARNLALLGNFDHAYQLMQQAQASFVALEETSSVIVTETNLADFDYVQGYYGSALRRYYQARDHLIRIGNNDPTLEVRLKLWMANCLVKLNRAQEACQLAVEGVKACRQLGVSLDMGDALREYATALVASGRLDEAVAALDEAWTIFNHGGFDHYASAAKLQQAELLLEKGSVAAAYDQARLFKQFFAAKGLVQYSVRADLVMIGALVMSSQQTETPREQEPQVELLQEAISLGRKTALEARQHNLQEQVYKSLHLLGQLTALQGNPGSAARYYHAAIAQIERILDNLVYDLSPSFLRTAWAVYEDMIALCLQQSQPERAFSYLERARSLALRQYFSKARLFLNAKGAAGEIVSTPALQVNSAGAAILRTQHELREWQQKYHDYSAQLADIDTSMASALNSSLYSVRGSWNTSAMQLNLPTDPRAVIQAELRRCEAKISELFERLHLHQLDTHVAARTPKKQAQSERSPQHMDIAQLRQHLAPGQLLLAYYLCKEKLIIFALTTERFITHENSDGGAQLERLLPLLHAYLQPAGWPDSQPPLQPIRRLLHKLYDLLVAPVTSLLPSPAGSLTIVPYGPLHELPFHALYNGSRFLVEDFQINYLPASNILTQLHTHRSKQQDTDTAALTRPPLVFGYSVHGYLRRVLDEAQRVSALLHGRCYLEGEATIARLVAEAPGSPIIHVATHGQSRLDAPNFSFVRLADGQLNAIDAFSLDLRQCELVTLSGCETGLALSGGGDEQLGLGRAFLAAGASSLVMSLWPVEDNATNELMQVFYQRLLSGDTRVQALRTAQCSLLHHTSSIYTHPYFWAAFRLVGDVGPLHYSKAKA